MEDLQHGKFYNWLSSQFPFHSCAMLRSTAGTNLLLELQVENYAVIDRVEVEFGAGLNLLTGETGAGKSILIDALGLLLGDRASADIIRHGAEKAVVTGVFEARKKSLAAVLDANGLDADGDQIILRREISSGGKARVFVNNQPATVAVLKLLAPHLATIHAQNESLMSFDAAERLRLLDGFARIDTAGIAAAYNRWRELQTRIADLERNEQDRLRLVDLWSFQKKEIEQAHLEAGEDERLEAEKRVLANSEKLYAAAMSGHEALYESNASAAALLRQAGRNLEELSRYDAKFQEQLAALDSARISIEDIGASLRDYAERINASPERLAEIEDRLSLLDRLKRKYGPSVAEVIAFSADVTRKLSEIENRDQLLDQLRKELGAAAREYLKLARAISQQRAETACKLQKLVEAEINDLAMNAKFRVEAAADEEQAAWTSTGLDHVQYLIATNPGDPLLPLERIASGGELSRVMLALKAVIEAGSGSRLKTESRELKTLVFDEIDTGIGGRAAEAVGKKLRSLSSGQQVVCITHLPQIACFADQHYRIEKTEHKEAGKLRTGTTIRRLSDAERREELARMLSGATITDTSLRHAEQMLKARA